MSPLPIENPGSGTFVSHRLLSALVLATVVPVGACSSSGETLPAPRPLIVHSGARITADPATMEEVDAWIRNQLAAIEEDPSFFVGRIEVEEESYPWEGLEIIGDTVRYRIESTATDAQTPYQIYAHLRLMDAMGRLDEWISEAPDLDAYGRERAIVSRIADSWLYGRAIFDAQPYRLLDEIIYAREAGWLDAFILTAQADRFPDEREAWLEENPGAQAEYRAWFQETFSRNPPGMTAGETGGG